ncbi:ElaB/YqjD/DUF883 family membrane-anchored ribosome-binding protein [Oxalobacteraceae bacterium GrIS 1.11]
MSPIQQKSSDGNSGLHARAGNDAREKLMNDMKSVISEAEDWLQNTAAHSGEDLLAAKETFVDTLQTAKNDLRQMEANLLAKTRRAADATDAYVKDNPWKAIGLGGAFGLLAGLLIGRK